MNKIRKITLTAIMTALCVVFNELITIDIPPTTSPMMRLSLGIIPIFIVAYYCGIIYSTISAVLADILGFFLVGMQKGYAFNPGYTLNALLSGLIIGFFILIRKFMATKKGLSLFIITDIVLTVSSVSLFSYMFMTHDLKDVDNKLFVLLLIVGISVVVNIVIILYGIFTKDSKDSTAIIMSFLVYLYVVSLCLTPLWVSLLTKINYFYYWIMRLVTVPLQVMIYSIIAKLLIIPINKIYTKVSR
ncbi:MAG: ECF transporter S component [Gammaproteobacteria bacterium]|nr:ECF transporter S component [Gammaproteobacteria bacterium]